MENKRRLKIALGLLLCGLQTACVWSTPSGIRELHRGMVGAAALDKKDTPYHELERHTESQKTIRVTFGGQDGRN